MDLAQLFVVFLQPVAYGSAAVFALLGIVGVRTPHRSPSPVSRKQSR
jgi:hypothetical protein